MKNLSLLLSINSVWIKEWYISFSSSFPCLFFPGCHQTLFLILFLSSDRKILYQHFPWFWQKSQHMEPESKKFKHRISAAMMCATHIPLLCSVVCCCLLHLPTVGQVSLVTNQDEGNVAVPLHPQDLFSKLLCRLKGIILRNGEHTQEPLPTSKIVISDSSIVLLSSCV